MAAVWISDKPLIVSVSITAICIPFLYGLPETIGPRGLASHCIILLHASQSVTLDRC